MDPGRRAMIEGGRSGGGPYSSDRRDITSPRRDPSTRISKPPRRDNNQSAPATSANSTKLASAVASSYQTQDEQSLQFVADEDKFVLRQSKKKADIRVREDRATPADNLAFHIRFMDPSRDVFDEDDADAEIDVPAPEDIVESLNADALDALDREITSFHTLETDERNKEYWTALRTLCRERRRKLRGRGMEGGRAVSSVADDINKILSPKSLEQLETLEKQIRAKLDSDLDIDVDYWDQLLKSLLVWKAKARLKKINEAVKQARVAILKKSNPELAEALEKGVAVAVAVATKPSLSIQRSAASGSRPAVAVSMAGFPSGMPSSTAAPIGTERFAETGGDFSQATKALYEREVARGVSENEEIFAGEEAIPGAPAKPLWADKYRPRKPRYFNRVQMGYEWNKYNQTHYDHDNPPPRVVQGYKFNIFYPDLIDKTRAPTFKIIREGGRRRGETVAPAGQEDTCLIRFTAGPPYEDIAFRIVDKEWDYSAKRERGFRSSFDKGILQLHFQFKRIFYRK